MALAAPLPTVVGHKRSRLWGVPVYWHLLSFDAPTVAVLWAWGFAHAFQIHVSLISIAVLGVGTWLIYVADRLLDAGSPDHSALRERHFFHARHREALLHGCAIAGALLLGLICIMPAIARRDDAILFAVAMVYFAGVHLPALRVRRWFPREAAVGILFALATAVPVWSAGVPEHAQLIAPVLLFAGLCTLNCMSIEAWEQTPGASFSVNVPIRTVPILATLIAAAAILLCLLFGDTMISPVTVLSAGALLILDQVHRRFARGGSAPGQREGLLLALRVAADAALLTPILFVVPWHR